MALNTLHNVTLSEAQISIILYTLEDYMSSDRKSNDPDLESDVNSISVSYTHLTLPTICSV